MTLAERLRAALAADDHAPVLLPGDSVAPYNDGRAARRPPCWSRSPTGPNPA